MMDRGSEKARISEILAILKKHRLIEGLTPQKLTEILQDLGAVYVKFGQILSMRPDLVPYEYCRALELLRTDADAFPLETVYEILRQEYGRNPEEIFTSIDPVPLGSASIAQVHAARLADGGSCVIKVQRPGLYAIMEQDIRLLKKCAGLLKYTPAGNTIDFCDVLDHLWTSAQEELDFVQEKNNLISFKKACENVRYADCPEVYDELCTGNVLVMENIGGHQVDDGEALEADGYDRKEIATKLVYHYIRQITRDRVFQADPHPGNIRVSDGKIYWIDLGMMGRLTVREAALYDEIIRTMDEGDYIGLTDALLSISNQQNTGDREAVIEALGGFFRKFDALTMSQMDMGLLMEGFLGILRDNHLSLPTGLTMLGRSLMVIQGTLVSIDPDVNILEIVKHYMKQEAVANLFSSDNIENELHKLYRSVPRLSSLPAHIDDLAAVMKSGDLSVNQKLVLTDRSAGMISSLLNRLITALILAALIIADAITLSLPQSPGMSPAAIVSVSLTGVFILLLLFLCVRKKPGK